MNKWLMLSDSLYMFGLGGVNRLEENNHYKSDGTKSDYKTVLYIGTSSIAVVKESIEEIKKLLTDNKE